MEAANPFRCRFCGFKECDELNPLLCHDAAEEFSCALLSGLEIMGELPEDNLLNSGLPQNGHAYRTPLKTDGGKSNVGHEYLSLNVETGNGRRRFVPRG